jgi:hypothetical protein
MSTLFNTNWAFAKGACAFAPCLVEASFLRSAQKVHWDRDADPLMRDVLGPLWLPCPFLTIFYTYVLRWTFCFRIQENPRSCMIKRFWTCSISLASLSPVKYKANGESTFWLPRWYYTASCSGCCEHFYSESCCRLSQRANGKIMRKKNNLMWGGLYQNKGSENKKGSALASEGLSIVSSQHVPFQG